MSDSQPASMSPKADCSRPTSRAVTDNRPKQSFLPQQMMKISVPLFVASWALIGYTYCLFPLLIALLARLAGRPAPEMGGWAEEDLPSVVVVVAAHNEEGFIAAKVRNTWQIDYPPDKLTLLIGSDGSSDSTPDILRSLRHPRLYARTFEQRRGKVSVVNDLMAEADADIVILSDANTTLAPDAVRKLVRHFRDPRVGCVNGALALEHGGGVSGEGLYWKYELWIKTNESRLGFVIGCYGGILAVRQGLYQPLPPTTIVEDFVLTMNIMADGWGVRFDPEARATEPASASSRAEWGRKVRIGAGDFQALGLTRRMLHPRQGLRAFSYWSHKVLRWFAPFLLIGAVAGNLGIATAQGFPAGGVFTWLLAAQAAGILASLLVYRLPEGSGPPAWLRPVSFFYLMNFALLCGFWRWVRGSQSAAWQQAARQASEQPV